MSPSDPFLSSCGLGAQNCSKMQYFVVRSSTVGVFEVAVVLWWCFCGGVCVVVFLWWCFCGVFVFFVVVARWCFGGVFVVKFLCWLCGGVFVVVWWCFL